MLNKVMENREMAPWLIMLSDLAWDMSSDPKIRLRGI